MADELDLEHLRNLCHDEYAGELGVPADQVLALLAEVERLRDWRGMLAGLAHLPAGATEGEIFAVLARVDSACADVALELAVAEQERAAAREEVARLTAERDLGAQMLAAVTADRDELRDEYRRALGELRRLHAEVAEEARVADGAGEGAERERVDTYPDERIGGGRPTCSICGAPVFGGPPPPRAYGARYPGRGAPSLPGTVAGEGSRVRQDCSGREDEPHRPPSTSDSTTELVAQSDPEEADHGDD